MRGSIIAVLFFSVASWAGSPLAQWVGDWSGGCTITSASSAPSKLTMNLSVTPISDTIYQWAIQYEGEPARNYELIQQEGASKHWVLDEKNGILIDRFINASFTRMSSLYTINGRVFSWSESLENNQIVIVADSWLIQNPRESGIPSMGLKVGSHQWSTTQSCRLERE